MLWDVGRPEAEAALAKSKDFGQRREIMSGYNR